MSVVKTASVLVAIVLGAVGLELLLFIAYFGYGIACMDTLAAGCVPPTSTFLASLLASMGILAIGVVASLISARSARVTAWTCALLLVLLGALELTQQHPGAATSDAIPAFIPAAFVFLAERMWSWQARSA